MQITTKDYWSNRESTVSIEEFVQFAVEDKLGVGGTIERHAANIENTICLIGRLIELLAEKNILSAPEIVTLVQNWNSGATASAAFSQEEG